MHVPGRYAEIRPPDRMGPGHRAGGHAHLVGARRDEHRAAHTLEPLRPV